LRHSLTHLGLARVHFGMRLFNIRAMAKGILGMNLRLVGML